MSLEWRRRLVGAVLGIPLGILVGVAAGLLSR